MFLLLAFAKRLPINQNFTYIVMESEVDLSPWASVMDLEKGRPWSFRGDEDDNGHWFYSFLGDLTIP